MTSTTLKCNQKTISEMAQAYQPYMVDPVPYSQFRAKVHGITITAYTSGKVLFQGNDAYLEAEKWQKDANQTSQDNKEQLPTNHYESLTLIGSDEVGNGSYFGPLTVCAVYLSPDQYPLIKELGVKDSKLLSDATIKEIAWQIQAATKYHLTICPPEKYNQAIGKYNAVSMKVSLHNFTINKLKEKLTSQELSNLNGVLIDEFTPPSNYHKYLIKEQNPYTQNLYFEKKAEAMHLSVACASIIARAAFLESLETLGKPYGLTLPSGAGNNIDKIGRQLVKQYGPQILNHTAKLHFKNTQKILGK